MPQIPYSGSLEQVLRVLQQLATSPAFTVEMQNVVSQMGTGAFTAANLKDANGNPFALNLNDTTFGSPSAWVPTAFLDCIVTSGLKLTPPYPRLELIGGPGRQQTASQGIAMEADTGEFVGWTYVIDAVVAAEADQAEPAQRQAHALIDGYERLIRRNEHLGGLVQLISAEGPPYPGGSIERQAGGNLAGAMIRFRVEVLRTYL